MGRSVCSLANRNLQSSQASFQHQEGKMTKKQVFERIAEYLSVAISVFENGQN